VLAHIDSPFVTKYYGSFLKESKIWIVMEFLAGGSCLDLVTPPPPPLSSILSSRHYSCSWRFPFFFFFLFAKF